MRRSQPYGSDSSRYNLRRQRQWLKPKTPCGMLAASPTPWSQLPGLSAVGAPLRLGGRKVTRAGGGPHTKKSSFFLYQFFKFLQPQQWHVQVSQLLWTKGPQVCGPLLLVGILKSLRAFNSSVATRAHATAAAMHFSADAGLIFLKE
jgi:hypothetical protein